MKNIQLYTCLFILILSTGCTGNYEEMNVNPNAPDDVPASTLLPKIIIETAKIQDMRTAGFYVHFFAQNSYIVEDRYRFPDNDMLSLWEGNYLRILQNAKVIKNKSVYLENKNMEAISEIMSVNAFHTLTDVYGDIPYSEALKSEEGIANPTYDKQADIYFDLLKRLENANAMLAESNGKIDGDILFNGNFQQWKVYCNSLMLRIAMRMSNVEPEKSKEIVERIAAHPEIYPVITSNDLNVLLKWTGVAPYREPWAQEYISGIDGSNHAVSKTMMDYLLSSADPRLSMYARPAKLDGSYTGAINGPVVGEEQARDQVSRIGTFYTTNEGGYTKLITYSEVCFIFAEASERGWNVGGKAELFYQSGIRSSLAYHEIGEDQIVAFLSAAPILYQSGQTKDNLYKIAFQKWVSLYLQGLQGWAECRRTDVPLLSPNPGTLYPGKHNRIPFRAVWTNTEDMYNNENFNRAKQDAGIINDFDQLWGSQLWWDKRTDVY